LNVGSIQDITGGHIDASHILPLYEDQHHGASIDAITRFRKASSEDPKDFISTRNFEGGKDEKQHNKNIDNIKQVKKQQG
jgi:hypothetical protein